MRLTAVGRPHGSFHDLLPVAARSLGRRLASRQPIWALFTHGQSRSLCQERDLRNGCTPWCNVDFIMMSKSFLASGALGCKDMVCYGELAHAMCCVRAQLEVESYPPTCAESHIPASILQAQG